MTVPDMDTLAISLQDGVARIALNRPDKANAINLRMWDELREAMRWLTPTRAALLRRA